MKKLLIIIILFPLFISAQTLKGKITDTKGESLTAANVIWLNTVSGTSTDNKGEFEIKLQDIIEKN